MDIFEEIRKRIEQKEFSKAKELIEKIEDEVERYNSLGIIHYYEGKINEALEFFKKALDTNPVHDDVLFNYSKVLFEKEEYFESWRYLTRINNKTWEVYDMLGDTQLKQNNPAMALHYYKKAMELSNIPEMKEKYQILRDQFKKDIKLAIFCLPGLDNFIKDIAQILSNIYDVKLVVTTDGKQIQEAYSWADIVWLEWANEMAVEITNKLPKDGKKIICRLHGYESLRKDLLSNIKWEKVDHVVFVAENVLKTSLENCSQLKFVPHSLIWNGIDLTKFTFKVRKPGYNLVFVGHFNYKKNPTLAVQILKKLTNIDSRYNISWAGQMQDERMWRYVNYVLKKMGIENRFKFDGFITNVNNYLESKNIFLSTSIHEGYGVAILEAMAKGIKPVIHNFYVAEEFYPREYIFNTIDEAIEMICSDDYDSTKYRDFVEQNCSLEKQIKMIDRIIKKHEFRSKKILTTFRNIEVSKISVNGLPVNIVDPYKLGVNVRPESYEDDLETALSKLKAPINQIPPHLLVTDKNIEYMIDFLEKVFTESTPYQKTKYYAFLLDMYKKGLYKNPPESIIESFIILYKNILKDRKIYKPIVAFLNDGLKGTSFHRGKKEVIDLPSDLLFWVISGRHRVAIANFLRFPTVPTYIVYNRFDDGTGALVQILPSYWKYYIEQNENIYEDQIKSTYVGIFNGNYQAIMDPAKKRIIREFVLKVMPRRLIDIGCNRGELSYDFIKYGIQVLGIDIAPREQLSLPDDYPFMQMDIVHEELPTTADVILFLSVYHHILYNYGIDTADEVFMKLFNKTHYLVFDSGHPEEKGIYRQAWINAMKKYFQTEKQLLDHFNIPYEILGRWHTSQGSFRTIVVFTNQNFSESE